MSSFTSSSSPEGRHGLARTGDRTFVRRFLLLLPALLAAVVVLSILLIRYDDPALSDIRHHELGYNTLAQHSFTRSGLDNDIVLVGDSTLLMGVMPKVLEERLQGSVINLGLFATSGLRTCTMLLDEYLQRNKRPKYVIFYFAASTPYYFRDHSYEKTYTQLKYGSILETLSHPDQVDVTDCIRAAWTIVNGIAGNVSRPAKARQRFRSDLAAMEANKGYLPNAVPTPIVDGLAMSTKLRNDLDLSHIDMLRKRYEALGIKVLYCVAPVAESDSGTEFFRGRYRDIDNSITVLPNRYFSDSRHLTEAGAMINSKAFAGFLASRLK